MTETPPSYTYAAIQPGPQQLKHRRRMRGIAIFFMVVGALACFAGILSMTGTSDRYTFDTALGFLIIGISVIVAALMAWNGSRLAPFLLLIWILLNFVEQNGAMTPAAILGSVRNVFYIGLIGLLAWHTFKYHRMAKETDTPIGGSAAVRWVGAILFALIGSLVGFGFWLESSDIETKVVSGKDLTEEQVAWLEEKEFLTKGEKPLLFYSEGLLSISEGGSLLTDQYVGGWLQEDGKTLSSWYRLGEVCEFKTISEGDMMSDAVYVIHNTDEEDFIELWLSNEDDLDAEFIRRARYLNDRKMHPAYKKICESGEPIDWNQFALERGISPDLVDHDGLPDGHRDWLLDQKYLLPNEHVKFFYSTGRYDISEGGVLLTDTHFGGWYQIEYQRSAIWQRLGTICSIEELSTEESANHVRYRMTPANDDWLEFSLPTKNDQNLTFMKLLADSNRAAKTPEHIAACEAPDESSVSEPDETE